MTETELTVALMNRYGTQAGNGQRYAVAAQVRSHAGFDARRTADFVAMDLWPSSELALHGHEIKVSRSDWLRELKDPAKAEEFTPYMNHWWIVVPDEHMVHAGELPDAWGLLAMRGEKLAVIRKAPHREAQPMPPTRLAALMRAVALTAGNYARLDAERRGRAVMTETRPPAADAADELDRTLWRAVYDWAVARAKWAAARAAADAAADPAPREDWDAVTLLGVMGACKNAGVTYDEMELVLWRLAHASDHRDFAELRDLARKHRPAPKGHLAPEVKEAIRAGNFEAVRVEYKTTSVIPNQAEAHVTETDTNGGNQE